MLCEVRAGVLCCVESKHVLCVVWFESVKGDDIRAGVLCCVRSQLVFCVVWFGVKLR